MYNPTTHLQFVCRFDNNDAHRLRPYVSIRPITWPCLDPQSSSRLSLSLRPHLRNVTSWRRNMRISFSFSSNNSSMSVFSFLLADSRSSVSYKNKLFIVIIYVSWTHRGHYQFWFIVHWTLNMFQRTFNKDKIIFVQENAIVCLGLNVLRHRGLNKHGGQLQTTFSNAFHWKMILSKNSSGTWSKIFQEH